MDGKDTKNFRKVKADLGDFYRNLAWVYFYRKITKSEKEWNPDTLYGTVANDTDPADNH